MATGGKKQGGRRNGAGGRRPAERRVRPPEATGRETDFYRRRSESRSDLVIHLANGETVRGVIERFDREMITVESDLGPEVVLRKRDIRYIEE